MRRLLAVLTILSVVCYPFLVYWGLLHLEPRHLGGLLLLLVLLRISTLPHFTWERIRALLPTLGTVSLVTALVVATNERLMLLLYPVLLNLALCLSFAWTLKQGPSMIERFARLQEHDLDERGQRYCRKVTVIWCVFFVLNASIAMSLVWKGTLAQWTLYNGVISYILIGSLMAGEWLYRKWKIEPNRRPKTSTAEPIS